jgi:hypothetical protein
MSSFCWKPLVLVLAAPLWLLGCEINTVEAPPPADTPLAVSFTTSFRMADATISGPLASVILDAPEITPRVVANGMVMAYVREAGTWTALPFTYGVESPDLPAVDYTVSLGYAFEVGLVEVFYDVSTPVALDLVPDRTVKVVVVQGDALTYSATRGGVDWSNYAAVRERFGLSE